MSLEKFLGKEWAVSFKKEIQWAIGKEFLVLQAVYWHFTWHYKFLCIMEIVNFYLGLLLLYILTSLFSVVFCTDIE